MSSTLYNCSFCKKEVRTRQEALQCDFCEEWQHRVCRTGISREFYRQLVRGTVELEDWRCYACCQEDTPQGAHALIPDSPPAIHDLMEFYDPRPPDVPDVDDLEFNVSSSFATAEDVHEVYVYINGIHFEYMEDGRRQVISQI